MLLLPLLAWGLARRFLPQRWALVLAERKARDTERAQQAERDAAMKVERAAAESENRELALQAERKAARDARYAAASRGRSADSCG